VLNRIGSVESWRNAHVMSGTAGRPPHGCPRRVSVCRGVLAFGASNRRGL